MWGAPRPSGRQHPQFQTSSHVIWGITMCRSQMREPQQNLTVPSASIYAFQKDTAEPQRISDSESQKVKLKLGPSDQPLAQGV